MLKSIIVYGISTGINRGVILIYLPVLLSVLTIWEYGIYSLTFVLSQLLLPMLSLNGSAAVMREGAEDSKEGFNLFFKYILITTIMTLLFSGIAYLTLNQTTYNWVVFSILLGGIEALHLLLLTQLRCLNFLWIYLIFILIKVVGFFIILLVLPLSGISLEKILVLQSFWYILVFILMMGILLLISRKEDFFGGRITLKVVIPYSIILIPHGISQWIISSSDRFIIKVFLGDADVGIYSIAYSIAMVLMLVNSGIALSLPQHLIRNYERWTNGDLRKKFISFYHIICVGIFFVVNLFLILDKRKFGFLTHHEEISITIIFIWASLHLLGLYLLYSNYLYYHKKTGILATQTLIAAIINVIITFVLVMKIGFNGAAIGTFISYSLYLLLIIRSAIKIEPKLKGRILKDLWYMPIVTVVIFVIGYILLILIL